MKLTPIDIKKHSFNSAFRGFASEEVEAFLDTVARQWEELLDELDRAKRRISELEGEMKKYREVENMLHKTLAQAEQSTLSVVENAKREAELIKQEAQLKSAQMIERGRNEVAAMADDVRRLESQKREVMSKLRILLSSQMELLNAFQSDEESFMMTNFMTKKNQKAEHQKVEPNADSKPQLDAPIPSPQPNEIIPSLDSFVAKSEMIPPAMPETPPPTNAKEEPVEVEPVQSEPRPTESMPSEPVNAIDALPSPIPPVSRVETAFASAEAMKAAFAKLSQPSAPELIAPELVEPQPTTEPLPEPTPAPLAETQSQSPKPQTVKIDIELEPNLKTTTTKKTVSIDDILDSLE